LRSVPQNGEVGTLVTVLVTQDIALAGMLAVLPILFSHERPEDDEHAVHSHAFFVIVCVQTAVFLIFCIGCRRRAKHVAQKVLNVGRRKMLQLDDEFFALVVMSYVFVLSSFTDRIGLSIELGAFIAGQSVSSLSCEVAERANQRLRSMKDILSALFFGSIGLVVSWRFLLDNILAILSVVWFILVLKIATAFLPLRLLAARGFESPAMTSFRVACILAHVGEFGIVLAARGSSLGVLSRHVHLLLVGANAVSLSLAPVVVRILEVVLPDHAHSVRVESHRSVLRLQV